MCQGPVCVGPHWSDAIGETECYRFAAKAGGQSPVAEALHKCAGGAIRVSESESLVELRCVYSGCEHVQDRVTALGKSNCAPCYGVYGSGWTQVERDAGPGGGSTE